jgi:hypothetical protein
MTEERLVLAELLEKASEGDFLRAVAEAVLQLLSDVKPRQWDSLLAIIEPSKTNVGMCRSDGADWYPFGERLTEDRGTARKVDVNWGGARMARSKSPYLIDGRLHDVVAALQVMGRNEERYSAEPRTWARLISSDIKKNEMYWRKIFKDHGEFFRQTGAEKIRYTLVMRAALPYAKKFIKDGEKYTLNQWQNFDKAKRDEHTRIPLSEGDIKLLIETALGFYKSAVERSQRWKTWLPPFISAILSAALAFIAVVLFGAHKPN